MSENIKIHEKDKQVFDMLQAELTLKIGKKITDCSTIELMKNKDIENIVCFDGGFDGIIPRFQS